MSTYKNIRKLRKKLRQIEHLEEKEDHLTDEEVSKCMKKVIIREELHRLLLAYSSEKSTNDNERDISHSYENNSKSAPESENSVQDFEENRIINFSTKQNLGNTNNSSGSGKKENILEPLPQARSVSKSTRTQETGNNHGGPDIKSPQPELCSPGKEKNSKSSASLSVNRGVKDASILEEWSNKKFQVSVLLSHNDIITAVDCCDNLLVSASRDTTVKLWNIDSLTELRSLGSHTGSVTDVLIIPGNVAAKLGKSIAISEDDHLILSGSTDCSLNVWSAKSGELLKSVYTYNSITKIAFYPALLLVATASDGGKLELWNIDIKTNVCSEKAHSDSITGLCVLDTRIFTCCAVDGEIKVYEARDNKLHCMFMSERLHNITGSIVTMRHIRSLGVSCDNIIYGDDGVNLKVFAWRKGLVKKLVNHKEEFGMTDAIYCHDNTMLTSAYDLDNGHGYVNVFAISAEPRYVATLDCEETGRILDVCYIRNQIGNITIVTAGLDLKVWTEVSEVRNGKQNLGTKIISSLSKPAQDSDIESDVEFTDSDSEGNSRRSSRRGSVQSQKSSWMSWCSLT